MAEVMNRIAWLEKQVITVQNFVNKYSSKLESDKAVFSDKISYESNMSLLNNYKRELRQERELLNREVLSFRVIGEPVNQGTMPLGMLAKLADKLNKTIHHSAYFVRNGVNATKGVNLETVRDIDLRLSGLDLGSCSLQIIGNIQDDLAGDNLLGDAYKKIFEILKDDDSISFGNIAPTIGNSAVHNLDSLLQDIQTYNVSLELKWDAPSGVMFRWGGSRESVTRAREKLCRVKTLEPVAIELSGTITDLSINGHIKILESESNKPIKVKFPSELLLKVDSLTLNDIVTATVSRQSTLDEITGQETHKYLLEDIEKYS